LASSALLGARYDTGAAAEHGITGALAHSKITAFASTAHHGAGGAIRVPHRRVVYDRVTRKFARRNLSTGQKAVKRARSGLCAPGERDSQRRPQELADSKEDPPQPTPASWSMPSNP
jgi:hypothetical protein